MIRTIVLCFLTCSLTLNWHYYTMQNDMRVLAASQVMTADSLAQDHQFNKMVAALNLPVKK